MKPLLLSILISTCLLSACGSEKNSNIANDIAPPTQAEGVGYAEQAMPSTRKANPAPADMDEAPDTIQKYLAYRYDYGFALPAKLVAPTVQSHAERCMAAGPQICQVLSSSTSNANEDYVSANLTLRAEPEWLETFTADILKSIDDAKGQVIHSGVSAEDLTRQIIDTDARLEAQKTLRTRLEGLLETRDAELKDLLALERELARVQGEIESAATTLKALRKRVSMSLVNINYQTKQVAVSRGALSPIATALKDFIGDFAYGLSAVIGFLARFLPWLIFVILPLIWLVRKFWRQRQSSKHHKAANS